MSILPQNSTSSPQRRLAVTFTLGVTIVLALSTIIFYLVMSPPMAELGLMLSFLSVTALISILAGYGAFRLGWLERAPSIRLAVLGGYVLASLLTFLNVWITANLMFADQHDLLLATILLLFASGIAVVLGGLFASALADRLQNLERAAQSIARGAFDTRLNIQGKDEVAQLAAAFNQMAARLQAAQQQQQELDTLRRDLIAWVSHDLQTPLASMRLVIEALADGVVEEPETRQRYLHSAQRDIRALSMLIDDLFQLAQLDAGGLALKPEYGSLSDLISDTLESFSSQAVQSGVSLTGEVAPGLDPVWMDTPRLGRVLNNLVKNALRHTPAGGQVRLAAQRTTSGVVVEVTDNGEGLQLADLPHIFERFYRGEKSRSRETGGAGLGLAIAKGIIEAHGGQIGVESQPGYHTRFWFTLPNKIE